MKRWSVRPSDRGGGVSTRGWIKSYSSRKLDVTPWHPPPPLRGQAQAGVWWLGGEDYSDEIRRGTFMWLTWICVSHLCGAFAIKYQVLSLHPGLNLQYLRSGLPGSGTSWPPPCWSLCLSKRYMERFCHKILQNWKKKKKVLKTLYVFTFLLKWNWIHLFPWWHQTQPPSLPCK